MLHSATANMNFLMIFISTITSTVLALNDGRYYRDDSGKYTPWGDEGRYYPDLSGKYIHDGKGYYIYDGSGLYKQYYFGKNGGLDYNLLANCPPPIVKKYDEVEDKWVVLDLIGRAEAISSNEGKTNQESGVSSDTNNEYDLENRISDGHESSTPSAKSSSSSKSPSSAEELPLTEQLKKLGAFKYVGANNSIYEISYFPDEGSLVPEQQQNHLPETRSTKVQQNGQRLKKRRQRIPTSNNNNHS